MAEDIYEPSNAEVDAFLKREIIKIIIREKDASHLKEYRLFQEERERLESRNKKIKRLSTVAIILSISVLLTEVGRIAIELMSH